MSRDGSFRFAEPVELPGHPGFSCTELDEHLAEALIARTLDSSDLRLREMTRDLARFSSSGQLAEWRPGRDLICLEDEARSLLGIVWVTDKPLPERDDYFDLASLREQRPSVTGAIRTYGRARGRGVLTMIFAKYALEALLRRRPEPTSLWYETRAHNLGARALGRQLGFSEVSGEAGGRVVGVRIPTSS